MPKQIVIIVGANGSIAQELAKQLKKNYFLIGISHSSLKSIYYDKIIKNVDIQNINLFQNVCEKICKNVHQIKGVIYASGVTIPDAICDLSVENFQKSININLQGYWLTVKFLYPLIVRSPGCSIVQINSKTGKKGSYKNSAYSASKFAGIGLTQSLALELVEYGVRVNAVCPGNVFESNTWKNNLFSAYAKTQNKSIQEIRQKYINLVPMKRSCTYTDIANVVEFLLSDKSSYMTGQAINITGGQQLT